MITNALLINTMLEFAYELDTFLDDEEYQAMTTIDDANRRCERADKVRRLKKANGRMIGTLMQAQKQ